MKHLVLALFAVVTAAAIALVALVAPTTRSPNTAPMTARQPPAPPPPPTPLSSLASSDRASPPPATRGLPAISTEQRIDPHERRATDRAQLEASGRTTAAWTRGAADVFATSLAAPEGAPDVRFGAIECYAAGCITTATYADFAAFNAVNRALPDSERFRQWQGSKRRSPPELQPDGRLSADWTLFPPAADDQLAMQQGDNR